MWKQGDVAMLRGHMVTVLRPGDPSSYTFFVRMPNGETIVAKASQLESSEGELAQTVRQAAQVPYEVEYLQQRCQSYQDRPGEFRTIVAKAVSVGALFPEELSRSIDVRVADIMVWAEGTLQPNPMTRKRVVGWIEDRIPRALEVMQQEQTESFQDELLGGDRYKAPEDLLDPEDQGAIQSVEPSEVRLIECAGNLWTIEFRKMGGQIVATSPMKDNLKVVAGNIMEAIFDVKNTLINDAASPEEVEPELITPSPEDLISDLTL